MPLVAVVEARRKLPVPGSEIAGVAVLKNSRSMVPVVSRPVSAAV